MMLSRGMIGFMAMLLVLSAFLGWQLLRAHETIGEKEQTIATKEADLSRANSQLIATNMLNRMNDAYQVGLQQKSSGIESASNLRAANVNKVINDKPENSAWAGSALPADIIRLHTRPAIVGADAYLHYLSESDAVRTTGQ